MAETTMIFDTNCVLCSGFVHFILRHERDQEIVFINAWSEKGKAIAAAHGMSVDDMHKTYLVVKDGVGHIRSDAGMVILSHLKLPWRILRILRIVPRPLRDCVYTLVAKHRYRWFGFEQNCFVPTEEARHRFVE